MNPSILLPFLTLGLSGCGASVSLSKLPAPQKQQICQPLADQIAGAYGCTARNLAGNNAGVTGRFRFTADTFFTASGRLGRYEKLRPVGELTTTTGRAPDCVAREIKRLSLNLDAFPNGLAVPIELESVIGDRKMPPRGTLSAERDRCLITISSADA